MCGGVGSVGGGGGGWGVGGGGGGGEGGGEEERGGRGCGGGAGGRGGGARRLAQPLSHGSLQGVGVSAVVAGVVADVRERLKGARQLQQGAWGAR